MAKKIPKKRRTCSELECDKPHHARGLCKSHYGRMHWQERKERGLSAQRRKLRRTPRVRYRRAKQAAKERGIVWGIYFGEYVGLLQKGCYYCGEELGGTGIGLDRKDTRRGYCLGNVLPCCWDCNALRGNRLSIEETRLLAGVLKEHRNAT